MAENVASIQLSDGTSGSFVVQFESQFVSFSSSVVALQGLIQISNAYLQGIILFNMVVISQNGSVYALDVSVLTNISQNYSQVMYQLEQIVIQVASQQIQLSITDTQGVLSAYIN